MEHKITERISQVLSKNDAVIVLEEDVCISNNEKVTPKMQVDSKISVIVPVYNTEKFISRCIDSLLNQTFTDFELLLVDDGIKDKSGSICDDYAFKDKLIRVLHKSNGDVCSARNAGIEVAKSGHITFVDSDDFVDSDYLEELWVG